MVINVKDAIQVRIVYNAVILILFYVLDVMMVMIWLMDFVNGQKYKIQHKTIILQIIHLIIILIIILIILRN